MRARRITIVASELLGAGSVGGAGTADSLLAVALGRAGHEVDLLFARWYDVGTLTPEWERIYSSSGVRVRQLEPRAHVDPRSLAPTVDVLRALRSDPPEIVIANDWRGLMFAPLRARETGIAFPATAFVILCHGPSTVLVEFSQKVPDAVERFATDVAERTCIGLADAVVSPSAWLLDWMRSREWWPVPESARVIQYISQTTALGERPPRAAAGERVRRLAFFGQLREGKGVRILITALNALEPELLGGVELLFLGRVTRRWTPETVGEALSDAVKERVAAIRFETALGRSEALAELRRPGTLALMPSLLDNSPNTVSECIEQGIPFVSTTAGGIPELVAEEDRERVLVEPRAEALEAALRRALASEEGAPPARPGLDPQAALAAWLELVDALEPPLRRAARPERPRVDIVAVGADAAARARRLGTSTKHAAVEVIATGSRAAGLAETAGEWVLFLDGAHDPDDGMLDALLEAQATSGADVVTCAVSLDASEDGPPGMRLFLGDAGAIGLIENHYGVVALVRRSLLDPATVVDGGKPDPDWPLLAGLVLSGARVATVPEPLCAYAGAPGTTRDVPGYGLDVLHLFEDGRARAHPDLPLLAATLGAAIFSGRTPAGPARSHPGLAARVREVRRTEGVGGLARRSLGRLRRLLRGAS